MDKMKRFLLLIVLLLAVNVAAHGPGPKWKTLSDTLINKPGDTYNVLKFANGSGDTLVTYFVDGKWYISGENAPSLVDTAIYLRNTGAYILAAGDTVGGSTGLHDFNRIAVDSLVAQLGAIVTLRIAGDDFTDLTGSGLQIGAGTLQADSGAGEVKTALNLRETITEVAKIGDDTTAFKTASDSTLAWDNRSYPIATADSSGIAAFNDENFGFTDEIVNIKAGGVSTGNILSGTILESDLNITNAPTGLDGYLLSLNEGAGNFTWITGGAGETNTLGDTGTFNGTSGFGLAGGKTGTVLKVKGLIEGANITIAASGDSGYTITGAAGSDTSLVLSEAAGGSDKVWWSGDTLHILQSGTADTFHISYDGTNWVLGSPGPTIIDTLFVGPVPVLQVGDSAVANIATAFPGRFMTGFADLHLGDSLSGMLAIGSFLIGQSTDTAYAGGDLDLKKTVLFMNRNGVTGNFEFLFVETNSMDIRFGIPKSGVGLGTWNPRSFIVAGPSVYHDSAAYGVYWGGDHLAFDTDGQGADGFIQHNFQVLDTIFVGSGTGSSVDTFTSTTLDELEARIRDTVLVVPIPATQVKMDTIGATTFTTAQDIQDVFHSAGWVSGGALVDTTLGTAGDSVYVAAGTGLIRALDNDTSTLSFCDWGDTTLLMKTDSVHFVGIEYNAGAPRVFATGDFTDFNFQTNFDIATVVNEGDVLHIETSPQAVGDHAKKMIRRIDDVAGILRDNRTGGLILGETGTRYVTVSAGNLWDKLNLFAIAAINTTPAGDDFDRYYRDGSGGFTKQATQTQWNNTQWDDGDGGLATHANNKYGVEWFYLEVDGGLVSLFGRATHNSAAIAETETVPATLPPRITQHGILIGRIIFQESGATATEIQTVFSTVFPATQATDHGNLAGLADDDHSQYLREADANVDTTGWNAAADKIDTLHFVFAIINPNAVYDTDVRFCFKPVLPSAITVTRIDVTCDADPTTEPAMSLKYADAFIGLASAVTIDVITTTAGVTTITSGFDDATIALGKALYFEFTADPEAALKSITVDMAYTVD